MEMEKKLNKLREQIKYESITHNNIYETEISYNYSGILDEWINDYSLYRKYSAHLLYTFETYFNTSLKYSCYLFFSFYEQIFDFKIDTHLKNDFLNDSLTDKDVENYKSMIEANFSTSIRLSDSSINLDTFNKVEIEGIIRGIVKVLHKSIRDVPQWDLSQMQVAYNDLIWLRPLCLEINNIELFYDTTNIFFDKVYISGFLQEARDMCEEVLLASLKDKMTFYGFFTCFRVYSNQGNIQGALMYGNLFLRAITTNKSILSETFRFEIIWQSLKFFRNCKLYDFAIDLYKSLPSGIITSAIEQQFLDASYFNCRILNFDEKIVFDLNEYLDKERENIIKEGEESCIPWLNMLYQMKRIKEKFRFDQSNLSFYITLFESIISPQKIELLKKNVSEDLEDLKQQLKISLLKLIRTRSGQDLVYDNNRVIGIATKLIEPSFNKEDIEGILLSMLVKSDYSIPFVDKETVEFTPIKIEEIESERFYETFENPQEIIEKINIDDNDSFIWLANSEKKLFQLTLNKGKYNFIKFGDWNVKEFNDFNNDIIPNLKFDRTEKDKYGYVRTLFEDDFELQAKDFLEKYKKFKLPLIENINESKRIFLIKDMNLSGLPHNLLLDQKQDFIGLKTSITNIISIEWLNLKINTPTVKNNNSKAIYIPIEGGDLTINMLYSNIEDILQKYKVDISKSITSISPIKSTINVICAHGEKDIAQSQLLFPNDNLIFTSLEGVLREGKVLVLLVCHSGTIKNMYFKNELKSLIKKYLLMGYEAIVAPAWSLHIDIPPLWLPIFFESINVGNLICDAVFEANRNVYKTFPTPEAWACMHLYGNPFFNIT